MQNIILRLTADGYRIAIAGTKKVLSFIVTKTMGEKVYSHSVVVTRDEAAVDAISLALNQCVDSIQKQIAEAK